MNSHRSLLSLNQHRTNVILLAVVLLAGVAISVGAAVTVWRQWQRNARLQFLAEAQNRFAVVSAELQSQIQLLEACQALYSGDREVSRSEFRAFGRLMLNRVRSANALLWAPRIPAEERESWERQHGIADGSKAGILELDATGKLSRAVFRPEYFPILFSEPEHVSQTLLGYDIASDKVRRHAIEDARESEEITASERITLLRPGQSADGILLVAPIFADTGSDPNGRKNLRGSVLAVMDFREVFAPVLDQFKPMGLRLELRDNSAPGGQQQLFTYVDRIQAAADQLAPRGRPERRMFMKDFAFGGRVWSFRCSSAATAIDGNIFGISTLVLLGGLVTTAFLGAFVWNLLRESERVNQLVEERTALLEQVNRNLKQEIDARGKAEERLGRSIAEKEVLLHEIHHRVRNNLQFICSLIRLETGHLADAKAVRLAKEMHNRVRSMALVYERLQTSDTLAEIDFSEYIRSLAEEIFRASRGGCKEISVRFQLERTQLNLDTAIPCALVVNELLANAFKYAFPPDQVPDSAANTVIVTLHSMENGEHVLAIQDNGVGLPAQVSLQSTATLGLQIVALLVEQLNGKIILEQRNGTHYIITFRDLHYQDRLQP